MSYEIRTPVDSTIYKSIPLHSTAQAQEAVKIAKEAQKSWKAVALEERKRIVAEFVNHLVSAKDEITKELAWLIGRFVLFRITPGAFVVECRFSSWFDFRSFCS